MRHLFSALTFAAAVTMATPLDAQPAGAKPSAAKVLRRYPNTHASQGVAVDARSIYAVSNSTIVKFDKRTGAKLAEWSGDPKRYPHVNSCAVIAADLVCASSNYPETPMRSSVEVFDPKTMRPVRSIALEAAPGSVTWIDRHDGRWWAAFANYDGRGGEPGRDHSFTALVSYDDGWKALDHWRFPAAVLERLAPRSTSGGGFGEDGLLYATGHDRPELYALRVPRGGGELALVTTLPIAVDGQAIAWDHGQGRHLYGIGRATGEVVAMQIPAAR